MDSFAFLKEGRRMAHQSDFDPNCAVRMQRESLFSVPPEREEALLAQAGFGDVRLFYAGLWIFGWIARA
jgi:tRNA (cmo5U34)-methyltransferase